MTVNHRELPATGVPGLERPNSLSGSDVNMGRGDRRGLEEGVCRLVWPKSDISKIFWG